MDLKQLRYFLRVAELGSFVKASELLGVAQPTLSKQIRALETELKASFFHRNGRGVLLTPLGVLFVDQARGVVHAADAALQVIETRDRRLTGRVICGLTPSVGALMIPEFARRFRAQLPHTTLSIVSHLSTTLHEQLRASRLDFAIFHNSPPSPALQAESLGSEVLYLVGAKQVGRRRASVDFEELDRLPLILPSRLHAIRQPIELEAARLGVRIEVGLEIDMLDSILALVADRAGYTISTRFPLLRPDVMNSLVVQRIVSPELRTHLDLVTPVQRALTPLHSAAIDLARLTYQDLTRSELQP